MNFNTLRSVFHNAFESHINYLLPVLAQNDNSKRNVHTSNHFQNLNVLKLPDKGTLENLCM